jgi:hypothetical protein
LIQIIYENSFETNELYPEVLAYISEVLSLEEIKNQEELDSTENALELIIANYTYFEMEFMSNIKLYINKFEKLLSYSLIPINNDSKNTILTLKTKTVRALSEIISYSENTEIFEPLIFKILETTLQAFENSNEIGNENEVNKIK